MSIDHGAAALLREVGLLPDGPVLWGRPLTSRKPGVYLVELAQPLPSAQLEMNRIGKWLEGLPGLRLDGERPTSRQLLGRLAAMWLPAETVLYIGGTAGSVGGRANALAHHLLGDRRPHADGQWLHAMTGIERARIWWAETDATEEYLDGLFSAFEAAARDAAAIAGGIHEARPAGALLMPWANARRPTGERQVHGITGSIAPDDAPAPAPPTHVVEVAAGNAEGASSEVRGTGVTRRAPRPPRTAPVVRKTPVPRGSTSTPASRAAAARAARVEPVPMTREAYARLEAELLELTRTLRPQVVARIKAAREHGDLKENAEYHAAREEQSFMEGRIRLLEERKRNAVLIEETGSGRVALGSTVVLEHEGESITYTIVGTTDARPAAGRISTSSPVGAALLGAAAGQDVDVRTPRGAVRYRVVEVR